MSRWDCVFTLTKVPALFQKIEVIKTEAEKPAEMAPEANASDSTISIDTVAQVELVVGTIEHAELVEKSDKLLKLHVDFGQKGKRTILAGIRKWYLPIDLDRQTGRIYL